MEKLKAFAGHWATGAVLVILGTGCFSAETQISGNPEITRSNPTPRPTSTPIAIGGGGGIATGSGTGSSVGMPDVSLFQFQANVYEAGPSPSPSASPAVQIRGADPMVCYFDSGNGHEVPPSLMVDMRMVVEGETRILKLLVNQFQLNADSKLPLTKSYLLSEIPVPTPTELLRNYSGDMSFGVQHGNSRRSYSTYRVISDDDVDEKSPGRCDLNTVVRSQTDTTIPGYFRILGSFNCPNLVKKAREGNAWKASTRRTITGNFNCLLKTQLSGLGTGSGTGTEK